MEKIKLLFKNKKFVVAFVLILLTLITGTVIFVQSKNKPVANNTAAPSETVAPPPTELPSLVNGVMVAPQAANKRVVAVMIENSPQARPQAGLVSADIVYEALVEGSITRFMAIYQQNLPEKAGPVRSARSYYIDWLSEFDAVYSHAGGSPTAINRIREYGIKDYPHANDGTYWREPKAGVASEHTLFTNVAKLYENSVNKKGWSATHDFQSWKFKNDASNAQTHTDIAMNFSGSNYNSVWTYDAATNSYARAMAGSAHKDRVSGEQIKAKTLIAMIVNRSANAPYSTGKESEWSMDTIGEGKAAVFRDGTVIEGIWKKPSRTERTRFYDSAGAEIELNRGKIWVHVLGQTSSYVATPIAPAAQ